MIAALGMYALLAMAPDGTRALTFTTSLKSVAVFRDGYGYYVREGQVKLENGWATTNFVPNAIRGTIWVYAGDKADRIDTVITTKDNSISFANPGELKQKLSDKLGLKFSIVTNSGQHFEGDLSRLLDDMLLLQDGVAFNAIPLAQIKSASFVGYPIKVKVDTAEPNKTTTIGIAYLQDGISWDPSYVLDVHGKEAFLELRASMRNTTESLNKSEVLFVVGSPFVTNRGLQDMSGIVPTAVTSAGVATSLPGTNGPVPGVHVEPEAERNSDPDKLDLKAITPRAPVSGEESGELYYYKKPDLSLDTNDVAMVSIFRSPVQISPRFEWNADGDEVVYLLRIQNSTKQPLTTGPVFVIENGKALGQETIKYTPAGDNAEVRLSRGIGIRVEQSEAEVKRSGSIHIGKSDFISVTLKGNLKITNFRSEDAILKVTKTARGRVIAQSDMGKVKQTQVLSGEVNPVNDLEWNVVVPKGSTMNLTYTIETYIFADRSGTPPVPATPDAGDR